MERRGVVEANSNRIRQVTVPDPLIQALIRLETPSRDRRHPNSFVVATREGNPIRPSSVGTLRLKPIGRELAMPWLSWQVLKRAHEALLSELRVQLSDVLVLSTRDPRDGGRQWRNCAPQKRSGAILQGRTLSTSEPTWRGIPAQRVTCTSAPAENTRMNREYQDKSNLNAVRWA